MRQSARSGYDDDLLIAETMLTRVLSNRLSFSVAIALALLACSIMAGWIFRIAGIVDIFPGHSMVFNSAAGFLMASVAIALASTPARAAVHLAGAAILAGFFFLVLLQHLVGITLGMDWPQLHDWLADPNPAPGRASILTCVGFLLLSAAMVSAHRPVGRRAVFRARVLTWTVGITGALAIAGHLLDFDAIFDIVLFSQVPPLTASAFMLVGLGWWSTWRRAPWNRSKLFTSEDARITFAEAAILTAVAGAAGIAGMAMLQRSAEEALVEGLAGIQASRVELFTRTVKYHSDFIESIARRPALIHIHARMAANPNDRDPVTFLHTAAQSSISEGLGFLEFRDPRGQVLAAAGRSMARPEMRVALPGTVPRTLAWAGELVLRVETPIRDGDVTIGFVIAEQSLSHLESSVFSSKDLGATGEVGICASLDLDRMTCFPQRFRSRTSVIQRQQRGLPLPMSFALDGRRGTIRSQDYRDRDVIAAYGPIGDLALGMVVKQDVTELYEPVRGRLMYALPMLALLLAAGIALLHSQVRPLVQRLVDSESRLRDSEERLKLALDNSRLALWDFDLVAKRIFLSEQWQHLMGGEPGATMVPISEFEARVHPDDLPQLRAHLVDVLKGVAAHYDIEHRVQTLTGQWIWVRSRGKVAARDPNGVALRMIGTNADITQRKSAELALAHQANHDALTGLPNRSLFEDRLARAMSRSRRSGKLMGVMYLDIDKFKSINDTLGHDMGDVLLKQFAQRLGQCVRSSDTVARLGGDEFTVILEELVTREDGEQLAQKIVAAMQPEFEFGQRTLHITTSVGLALYQGESGVTKSTLTKKADEALYAAKGAGRNNYQVAA